MKETPLARPDRSEIVPGLWIGGGDCETGFPGTVIDVREEMPSRKETIHIPVFTELVNGGWRVRPKMASKAIAEIDARLRSGEQVLVRCGSGVERSPAIVALYLIRRKGLGLAEAYGLIRRNRPQAMEEPDMLPLTHQERTR